MLVSSARVCASEKADAAFWDRVDLVKRIVDKSENQNKNL